MANYQEEPSCLDAAYERLAIEQGLVKEPVFPENRKKLDSNVQEVVHSMIGRAATGYQKYGVTTERTDLTTQEWLQHLQEELMDAVIYIQRIKKDLNGH